MQVIKDGLLVGHVYQSSNGLWVAQLDKAISIRSQSYLTEGEAIKALEGFNLNQLNNNPSLEALDRVTVQQH